jgi:long-subunit acyl-CoA synthetase (AMP-forming)
MKFTSLAERFRGNTAAKIVEIDGAGRRRALTFARLAELADEKAGQLTEAGVQPGHVVGIRAKNSIEWIAWDLAALATGAVIQAFPEETAPEDIDGFIREQGLALLVADGATTADHPSVLGPADTALTQVVAPTARTVEVGDLHSLVYSSGTSGKLKGLEISKTGTEYVIGRFIECFGITDADAHLIFLPLANYQQRLSVYCCLWAGARIVIAPYQRVFGAIASERPTFVIAPPVFYDAALQLFAKTGAGKTLGEFFGGRLRFMITGMAPIRRATLDAYWAGGVKLLEAYGLTECGMIAWNTEANHRVGTVGALIDPGSVEFQPGGELLIRRAAPLSRGYFDADPETAAEVFHPDGAIATGDFGELDADGFLTLKGRKKDVIALGSGRKVHPAEIESFFAQLPGIAEIVVVPTPRSNRLGAIVTLAGPADASAQASARRLVEQTNETLEPYQRVATVVFSKQPLNGDPQFLTGNMKLSRPAATGYFAELLADGPAQP